MPKSGNIYDIRIEIERRQEGFECDLFAKISSSLKVSSNSISVKLA